MRIFVLLILLLSSQVFASRPIGLILKRSIPGHPGVINAFVALPSGQVVINDEANHVLQRDALTGKIIRSYPITKPGAMKLSVGGSLLLIETPTSISAWNWRTGKRHFEYPIQSPVTTMSYAEATGRLVWSSEDSEEIVRVVDLKPRSKPRQIKLGTSDVTALQLKLDGTSLLTGSSDGILKSVDVLTGKVKFSLDLPIRRIQQLELTADQQQVLVGGASVALVNLNTKRLIRMFTSSASQSLAWNANQTQFVATSEDQYVHIHAISQSKPVKTIIATRWLMRGSGWLPNGNLVTVSKDGIVATWNKFGQQRSSFIASEGSVGKLKLLPDGKSVLTTALDGLVRHWSLEGKLLRTWSLERNRLYGISISPDGKFFAVVDDVRKDFDATSSIHVYALNQTKPVIVFPTKVELLTTEFSPDSQTLAAAGEKPGVWLFDLRTHKSLGVLKHEDMVFKVSFSLDGSHLVTGSFEDTYIWDLKLKTLERHVPHLHNPVMLPDGTGFLAVNRDTGIPVRVSFGAGTDQPLDGYPHHANKLTVSKDGSSLLGANLDNSLTLWSLESNTALFTQKIANSDPNAASTALSVEFLPDDAGIVLGGPTGVGLVTYTFRLSDPLNGVFPLGKQNGSIQALAFSSNAKFLAVGSEKALQVWNVNTLSLEPIAVDVNAPVAALQYAPDDTSLAVSRSAPDGAIKMLDSLDLLPTQVIQRKTSPMVGALAFSPDVTRLAFPGGDGTVKIWAVKEKQLETSLPGFANGVAGLAFNQDGSRLIIGTISSALEVWDTKTWQRSAKIDVPGANSAFDYNPRTDQVCLGDDQGRITLVNLSTNQIVNTFDSGPQPVISVSFTSDGVHLTSAVTEGPATIWETGTGRKINVFGDPRDDITVARWSPDDFYLATGHRSGAIRLWKRENLIAKR